MKKWGYLAAGLFMIAFFISILPLSAIAAESNMRSSVKLSLNGERLNLYAADHLTIKQGRIFIQLYELMDLLDGSLDWQKETGTVAAKWQSHKIEFKVQSNLCTVNGQTVKLNGTTFLVHNRLMVPLRSVCEILDIDLKWDDQSRIVNLDVPDLLVTERFYHSVIPAQIAFINHDHLFIMDGSRPGSQPVLVSRQGENEIVGWSADGQWLAYLNSPVKHSYSEEKYLWVVKADGSGATRLDDHPLRDSYIMNHPEWSPQDNALAYIVRESADSYDSLPGVKIASYRDGKWRHDHLDVPDSSNHVFDLAWAPDGQSLAVSLPITKRQGLRINRLYLTGQTSSLITINKETGEAENQWTDSPREACGMKWSPDGNYLAYYLCPPSASMTADGTNLQVLDTQSKRTINLGCSLAYNEWLAWSGDSTRLAFIKGCGRDVVTNKKLGIVDLYNGEAIKKDYSQPGQVDAQPLWVPGSDTLLFCRGKENKDYYNARTRVMVPGQSIWQKAADDSIKNVADRSTEGADYAPTVSKDGQTLLYLHLNEWDQGSLIMQGFNDAGDSVPVKILDMSGGSAGFYGSYLPHWFSIYWLH